MVVQRTVIFAVPTTCCDLPAGLHDCNSVSTTCCLQLPRSLCALCACAVALDAGQISRWRGAQAALQAGRGPCNRRHSRKGGGGGGTSTKPGGAPLARTGPEQSSAHQIACKQGKQRPQGVGLHAAKGPATQTSSRPFPHVAMSSKSSPRPTRGEPRQRKEQERLEHRPGGRGAALGRLDPPQRWYRSAGKQQITAAWLAGSRSSLPGARPHVGGAVAVRLGSAALCIKPACGQAGCIVIRKARIACSGLCGYESWGGCIKGKLGSR